MRQSIRIVLGLYLLSASTALKLNVPDDSSNLPAGDGHRFTIGVITFPANYTFSNQNENDDDLLVNLANTSHQAKNTAAVWNARREHMYEIKVSLTKPSEHTIKSIRQTQGEPIELSKHALEGGGLLGELMKDLSLDAANKLKSCGDIQGKAVGHLEQAKKKLKKLDGPGLWLIFAPETVKGKDLAMHAPKKSIILGNGYDEGVLDKFNINGKKVHNLWFPCGLQVMFWHDWAQHGSPMFLMDRDKQRESLLENPKKLSIVYQQSSCYPEREEGWDNMCQGLHSSGQKCYAMGDCNGKKHLGVHPPFNSAGGRKAGLWVEAAVANYKKFKFVYALEHQRNSFGYLTEKLFLPLQAGAIPVYTGDKHALDLLGVNPKSYIYVTPDTRGEALKEVQKLLEDDDEYQDRVTQPVIDEEKFKEYFTFHSSTWPKYGDQARQKMINAMIDVCQ